LDGHVVLEIANAHSFFSSADWPGVLWKPLALASQAGIDLIELLSM
jgi:hypothetical protein